VIGRKRNAMKPQNRTINLYWVSTEDHREDWFVLATTRRAAASFHERYEEYSTYAASARMIIADAHLPKYANGPPPCHAQIQELEALGFQTVADGPLRGAMGYEGEAFAEGFVEALIMEAHDNQAEVAGKGRPKRTKRTPTTRN
jgi:hypothetical protein